MAVLSDQYTGLPSIELLYDRLKMAMAQHQRNGNKAVLMLLESRAPLSDDFRRVIIQRLQNAVRTTDTVSMLDTATFTVLLTDLQDSENASRVVDALIQKCQQPYQSQGDILRYRPSIGMAVYPDDANQLQDWVSKAHQALDVAKAESNGVYKFYTEDMNVRAHHLRTLSINLRKAWVRDELKLYGQPIFERKSGNCVAVELLLLWEHPEEGVISASQFADITQITGSWSSACERLILGAIDGLNKHPNLRWTWNVPGNLDGRNLDDLLPWAIMSQYKGNKANLGLEIPEDLLISRPDVTQSWVSHWTQYGGHVVLDHFAQNPLSPSLLEQLTIEEIKTDTPKFQPYANALAQAYGWRFVQKNVDHMVTWNALPPHALAQGHALHDAIPLDQLLSLNLIRCAL